MLRILTDVEEPRVAVEWRQRTDFHPEIVGGKGLLSDIVAATRFFLLYKEYDVIVLSGGRKGSIFSIILGLWPGKKPPILMTDCLWYKPRNPLKLWLKRIQFCLMAWSITKFVVWASHEVQDYAAVFRIPEQKLQYIPHHHTLEGYEFEVTNGDYIFSGGDGDRDYATLIEAVRDLGVKVIIATRRKDWNGNISIPPNVEAFPVSQEDFRRWMAGSKMVVVPMEKGLLHSGGQQTYLNALAMGKPVIVADDCGAKDYIENGVNGFIVPSGDSRALRNFIRLILEDAEVANRLSNNARAAYEMFSTPKCMGRILEVTEEIVSQNRMKRNLSDFTFPEDP